MKIFSINIPSIRAPRKVQENTPMPILPQEPICDVFQRSVKKFPDFKCDTAESTSPNYTTITDKRHKDRMAKYGSKEALPPAREVSKQEFQAMKDVQYELGEYDEVQKKLKENKPLNEKEEKFLVSILNQMKPSENSRILWRSVGIYDGFEEQIKNGIMRLDCITSTNARYNDFFDFFKPSSYIKKDNMSVKKEGYILKFNVPKGTKMLDCNATYKKKYTRMASEVVLPPSLWQVNSIDNDLKVIELSPLKTNK